MTATSRHLPNFAVTGNAVAKLLELTQRYHKKLKFRVFADDDGQLNLRVHDKEYAGDWTMTVGDVGVSFCRKTMRRAQSLALDCRGCLNNETGFVFLLHDQRDVLADLDGDDVIARVLSEEAEVCDAYGEYCFTVYA